MLAVVLSGCGISETSIDQLNNCKKPAIVYSKHNATEWYDDDEMTLKDAEGKLLQLDSRKLSQLVDKFNVGDTIK
jgi:hypothetical protein